MTRALVALALVLGASAPALAQDMPLSQILIDGEGWKKVDKPAVKPQSKSVLHTTLSVDGGTAFLGGPNQQFLLAGPLDGDTVNLARTAPYAPLRPRRGEKTIDVTGLGADRDGRIYAATSLGVQVFDPTGRLCGVLTPAAPGKPEAMTFEGDTLTLWIGGTKYARKLRTEAVK